MPKSSRRSYGVFLDSDLLESPAFYKLNGSAIRVLMRFYQRRKINTKKVGKRTIKEIVNNGEIVFTYDNAMDLGFPKATFQRALNALIECGFIDIAQTGAGLYRSATFYSISDRWQQYGTPKFIPFVKPRRGKTGFKKGHRPYGNQNKTITRSDNGSVTKSGNDSQ